MRFHVLGICHTVSSKEYLSCAFTQKVVKFCSMMIGNALEREKKKLMSKEELVKHKTIHYIIHYGHERSDVDADEHVTVMTDEILIKTYGNYDWKKDFFKHQVNDFAHNSFTYSTLAELYKRRMPGDFILCFWGYGHQKIAEPFNSECLVVEPGIGYPAGSSFADFKVYESYAVMHNHYGIRKIIHPPWYDCVIPNYFDPNDFTFKNEKDNYFLYLGRITRAKGVDIILHLAKKMGFRLLIAGQGSLEKEMGETNIPINIQYVGFADVEKRNELMAGARALIISTYYIEPFGGVAVEAMMSGTPVISCDWGVFNETVLHGLTGYRCRTIDQFEWALRNIDKISPQVCRDWAINNFSLNKIRKMYEEYFDMLLKVKFNEGFTLEDPSRTELDWLYKKYPNQNQNQNQNQIVPNKKPKVLLFTETKWAFGRICQAIQKYSKKIDIDIIDWGNGIPDKNKLDLYDLIYVTVWDVARVIELKYPNLKNKITFSGHGKVDFIKMNFDELINQSITENQINNFIIDTKLIDWLKNRKLGFSVVSHELYNLLTSAPYNFIKNEQIFLTQCAADDEIFIPIKPEFDIVVDKTSNQALKVVYGLPCQPRSPCGRGLELPLQSKKESVVRFHGYDVKRKFIVKNIAEKIKNETDNNIEFIFPPDIISFENMHAYYQQGDVWLCISHSEGNPLGAFEAAACGLTVITTKVGEMPEFIKDGNNGFLIDNDNIEKIEKDIIDCLKILANDRKQLTQMKNNMLLFFMNNWTWKHKIHQWENYFLEQIRKNHDSY